MKFSIGFNMLIFLFVINTLIININHSMKSTKLNDILNKRIAPEFELKKYFAKKAKKAEATKANACIMTFVDSDKLEQWLKTMIELENKFNKKFKYSYLIFTESDLSLEKKTTISILTESNVEYAVIPEQFWRFPKHIQTRKVKKSFKNIITRSKLNSMYKSRYFSGYFFRHELAIKYDYYWFIEPNSNLPCHIDSDPFIKLVERKKSVSFFVLSTESFKNKKSLLIKTLKNWANLIKKPISNLDLICSMNSHISIGSLNMFRDSRYLDYFDLIDNSGGFFYEGWKDWTIKKIYIDIMINTESIAIFDYFPLITGNANRLGFYCPTNINKDCSNVTIDFCAKASTHKNVVECINKLDKLF
jgi:alpha 1,2-mannosyltransferase